MSELIRAALMKGIQSGQNVVFSPLSLQIAAAMLARAASPVDRERIEQSGVGDISDETLLANWNLPLDLNNGVWYQSGMRPTEDYKAVLERIFGAVLVPIDFGLTSLAAAQINSYTAEVTDGMIDQIVTEQMLLDALAVLLNTTLLKASWASKFEFGNTQKGEFEGVQSPVDFMHKYSARMPYVEMLYGQSIQLTRTDGGTVQIVLPHEGIELAELVNDIGLLLDMRHRPEEVNLTLPRVAVNGSIDGGKLLGIESFSLPGLGINHAVPVQIHQAATVKWNEEGVEAAAVSIDGPVLLCIPPDMVVNRPFLFVVRECDGTISFVGSIYNPLG